MKQINKFKPAGQSGFTIIELMIAGTLGIVLLAGVIQLFLGSNRNYSMQAELSNIQENGRFAMMFLEDQIQRGSWTEDDSVEAPIDLLTVGQTTDGVNDSFTITYRTIADGVNNRDCNDAETPSAVVSNRFYVDGTDLMCQGNGGGAAQPLLSNVENFQILYGVETDVGCPDGVVNSYLNRDSLATNANILSVRFALLLKSERDVLPDAEVKTFQMLDQSYPTPNDKFARRLFQQTVFMPNAVYATVGSPASVIECMISTVNTPA